MTVLLVSGSRAGFRFRRQERRPASDTGVQNLLVAGAGDTAESVVREILRMPIEEYRVVGLVDDDPARKGLLIHGIPVLGACEEIPALCEGHSVKKIIIAMPSNMQDQTQRVIDLCRSTQLAFQVFPDAGDVIAGRLSVASKPP